MYAGIAVVKAIGKEQVEELILYPSRGVRIDTKVLRTGRHHRGDATTVQPPLLAIGDRFEAVEDVLISHGRRPRQIAISP